MIYCDDPGPGIGVEDNAALLLAYADALADAVLLACSWTVAAPELEAKILLASHLHDDAVACASLRRRAESLVGPDAAADGATRNALRRRVAAASRAQATPLRLHGLYAGFKQPLAEALRAHAARTHAIWDQPTVLLLEELAARLERAVAAADSPRAEIARRVPTGASGNLDMRWRELLGSTAPATEIALDLPATPRRDARFHVVEQAPFAVVGDAESTAKILHAALMCIEIITIEVCSRMLTDFHAAMPFDFVLDLTRQCWDEARHAMLCSDRIQQLGFAIGRFPIDLQLWHVSRDLPLAERLAAHQRIGEQLGTDGAILNASVARAAGDDHTARIFEYITIDEVAHVGYGNKWLRFLAPDPVQREGVHERAAGARRRFGITVSGPAELPFNRWASERSGFAAEEIDALERARRSGRG